MRKTWFITGAARGMGVDFVKAALKAGHNVVATARDVKRINEVFGSGNDQLLAVALDVTDASQSLAAVESALKKFGRIDVLVNNAGYGLLGTFEESTPEQVRKQFETNVFGMMNVSRAVVPHLRKQRSGHIFNISSVAGYSAVWGASLYAGSKFAVEGFTQGLAAEMAPFGVHVTCVSPGFFRTDFLDTSSAAYVGGVIPDYTERMKEFREFHDNRNHSQAGDPAKLGEVLVKLSEMPNPPTSYLAGSDAVEWVTSVLKQKLEEVEKQAPLSASTDGKWEADTKRY